MKNNITPELRFSVLSFARDSLERNYYAKRDNLTLSSADNPPSRKELDKIEYPTNEEVVNLAQKILKFIDK